MTREHGSQMLKGLLALIVLRLLDGEESYGYELVTRIHACGLTDVAEGSVYPALGRLEKDGMVASRLVASPNGPARKYYTLSPAGRDLLRDLEATWTDFSAAISKLFKTTSSQIGDKS